MTLNKWKLRNHNYVVVKICIIVMFSPFQYMNCSNFLFLILEPEHVTMSIYTYSCLHFSIYMYLWWHVFYGYAYIIIRITNKE